VSALAGYRGDRNVYQPDASLNGGERRLLAAVCRWARTAGWFPGHRLGWVNQVHAVAVSYEPGSLNVWWRLPSSRWPTLPVAYPVASLDEALHILIGLRLLPGWFCTHGRQALIDVARTFDRIADDVVQMAGWSPTSDAGVAARTWREAAHRSRYLAGLVVPR
jgi:hypothetical protein